MITQLGEDGSVVALLRVSLVFEYLLNLAADSLALFQQEGIQGVM